MFGSSHFAARRRFRDHFVSCLEKSVLRHKFENPYVVSQPGGEMTSRTLSEILRAIHRVKRYQKQATIVINLGDNDLRRAVDKHGKICDLMQKFERIASEATWKVNICFIGLVPSPETHLATKDYFQQVSFSFRFQTGLCKFCEVLE